MKKALASLLIALPLFAGAASRRAAVENGLLGPMLLTGEPSMRLEERMRHYAVPGMSIAVWKDGKIDWTAGYGNVKADTLLQAGSISKSLAAVAAMRVLARHGLSLDADVNTQLKSWKLPAAGVTVATILNHTSGLNVPGFPGFERGDPIPSLIDELEGRGNTQALALDAKPGPVHYSGGGYLLLQQLLVDVDGRSIDDILQAEVLKPAKMRDSTFVQPLPPAWAARAASGMDEEGMPVNGGSYVFPEKTAGGLWATSADIARFVIALQKGKLLSPAQTKRMHDQSLGVLPWTGGYFAHAGGNTGFTTLYIASRTRADGVALLANSETAKGLMFEIVRAVAKEYRWPGYVPEPRTLAKDVDASKYFGRYRFDDDDVLAVKPSGAQLLITRTAGTQKRLDALSETEFLDRETGDVYVFGKDSVTLNGVTATRTRAAIPMDVIVRDIDQGIAMYGHVDASVLTEERLRVRGVALQKSGNLPSALALLKLNVEKHPDSAAAYDALATAQLAAGDEAGARASSQKVLEALKTDWTPTASWRQVYRKRAERRLK